MTFFITRESVIYGKCDVISGMKWLKWYVHYVQEGNGVVDMGIASILLICIFCYVDFVSE